MDGSTGWGAGGRVAARLALAILGAFVALFVLATLLRAAGLAAAQSADEAPFVQSVTPPPGARHVPWDAATDGSLTITFSEPVTLTAPLQLVCERSQVHALTIQGGPVTYAFLSDQPFLPGETCTPRMLATSVSDHDADDPPDAMLIDYTWSFRTAAEPILINEIDTLTDLGTADFIELYDGGQGHTDLAGLTLVLYRGDETSVYVAVGLDGYQTNGDGYFVIGAAATPGVDLLWATDALRDGPDAAAIYDAPESEFPRNAPLSTDHLIDAVVYGPAGAALLALLADGQTPLDEASRGMASSDSNQRCPNGGGRPRETTAFDQNNPTPGADNDCRHDDPPQLVAVSPTPGQTGVALDARIELVFSEPVQPSAKPLTLVCDASGLHRYTVDGGGATYRFTPEEPLAKGETCAVKVLAEQISDTDTDDPPDHLVVDVSWQFETAVPVAEGIILNEIDADTPGVDAVEFIELYDGGAGHTALDGLAVVLFNGNDDRSYRTVDLDGFTTDAAGYFVLGNAAVAGAGATFPDGTLQNGPDAAALVAGNEAEYPNGTPVTATVPIDAIVYGRPEDEDAGLQPLLNPNQPQVDENGRDQADAHSNQRCPNGAGGPRNTVAYKQNTPTPGATNDCLTDFPPEVASTTPSRGATGVSVEPVIMVEFNEAVVVKKKWFTLQCDLSGSHTVQTSGGPTTFSVTPVESLAHAEECTATVVANQVNDRDTDDPPDVMAHKKSWAFTTAAAPADFILINEIDADTPSSDAAEFVELYDGGVGHAALDGLSLVFFNGSTFLSYRAIDLDGTRTDEGGYLLVGNAGVAPDVVFADGALQNGPDAVALYAADATAFPTNSPIRQQGLLDAIVYGDPALVPAQLLPLLEADQLAVDEGGRGSADTHSLQRCPNGSGGQRRTASYLANTPTPGEASACVTDDAPQVNGVSPQAGTTGVAIHSALAVTFSEPVTLLADAISLSCATGGPRALAVSGGPQTITLTPTAPLLYNDHCQARINAARVSDVDAADPPDHPSQDYEWSFSTGQPPPDFIVINEVDADTPGSDAAEFIELYDGGVGHTDLTGLVLVLFNGSDDRSYFAVNLAGAQTNGVGYLLVGNNGVAGSSVVLPTGILQNGADAVALYAGDAAGFPNGTSLHTQGLLDAVVYGTGDPADAGLLALLMAGEAQLDEAGRGAADGYSNGRCPDGAGGPRRSAAFRQDGPSPGAPNHCTVDAAPAVTAAMPSDGATGVSPVASLEVTFTEDVQLDSGWYAIHCQSSGGHTAELSGGPRAYTLRPHLPFAPQETCAVTLFAAAIHDVDGDDPPDHLTADVAWSFTTAAAPADFVLINEIDANTPGSDTLEFIELYDGGVGDTDLSGLVVVLWNGSDDLAYRAIELDGQRTDAAGKFVLGNAAVAGVDMVLANGTLQNGPDAVALLAGRAADYPPGTPIATANLIDAVVYGPADAPDDGLLALLAAGQPPIDEAGRGAAEEHSLQRCPDGAGGPRHTEGYRPSLPTPGASNHCSSDEPPEVLSVIPEGGAVSVSPGTALTITFSEDVAPTGQWFAIHCTTSGPHPAAAAAGPREFTLTPDQAFAGGESCAVTLSAAAIHDTDADDPPDTLAADYHWSFQIAEPAAEGVLINELDTNTPGNDRAEFVELYDGGAGHTSLDGLVLVLWNGSDDRAYRAIELSGHETDGNGYFVLGNASLDPGLVIPGGALQNGPDAIALYAGQAADFPAGAPLTVIGLRDAVVYGPADAPDAGLLALLPPGEPQVDEAGRAAAETHSLQRCPDAAGGPRHTAAYRPAPPTPGAANECPVDEPPTVVAVTPPDGATGVPPASPLTIRFSEDVTLGGAWLAIDCAASGRHDSAVTGGPREFTLTPAVPFAAGEACSVTLDAQSIHDADADDPPDGLLADYRWRFHTAVSPAAGILINEIDADTPGSDRAEFIELYDGGAGHTPLDGLIVVFWNGQSDAAYRAIDLAGQHTDAAGYFVLGNAALEPDLVFGGGALQNGPDAIAIYAGSVAGFPAGASLTTEGLVDALVYGPAEAPDAGLLALLEPGQPQIDEAARRAAEDDALARCPNGQGGPRRTTAYRPASPTPGGPNACPPPDSPPAVIALSPADGATGVAVDAALVITFDEDVTVDAGWLALECLAAGPLPLVPSGGPRTYTLTPAAPLPPGDQCAARLVAVAVHDADADDPPDNPAADLLWHFQLAPAVPAPHPAFTSDGPLWIGQMAHFTNTTLGDGPLSYVWDFGDGRPPATDAQPSHRYVAVGVYTVTLTASNPGGAATFTSTIEVRPRAVALPITFSDE